MQLIHNNPWELMSSLRRDIDRRFHTDTPEGFVPAVDIYEEATRFIVQADLPGVDASLIEITVDDGLLTIKGEREDAKAPDGSTVQRTELPRGGFERSFKLPETVASEGFVADYRDGVLTVSIPKAKQTAPYRIEVTAN